jgi:hypothetical protein
MGRRGCHRAGPCTELWRRCVGREVRLVGQEDISSLVGREQVRYQSGMYVCAEGRSKRGGQSHADVEAACERDYLNMCHERQPDAVHARS